MKRTPTKILESITKRGGQATIYELCADTELSYAYISWNLRVLEAQGFVTKNKSSADNRQMIWALKQGGNQQ